MEEMGQDSCMRSSGRKTSDNFKNETEFYKDCGGFFKIELVKPRKQRIGIVGEIYIKYCHLGNWDMIRFLEKNNCESHTNGLSWYAMYYIDSHLSDVSKIEQAAYRIGLKLFGSLQRSMIAAMRQYGFYSMEEFQIMKKEADGYVNWTYRTGDGWLIGAEMVGHILHDCKKVLAVQPFGCMPNHICGRIVSFHSAKASGRAYCEC